MQCIECKHAISVPALQLAMEQRQHFALVRNGEVCAHCAMKAVKVLAHHHPISPALRHSMECTYCGIASPIMRWRFQMKTDYLDHIAMCEKCYGVVRDDLLRQVPGMVGWFELEWNTGVAQSGKRLPYAIGTNVRVKNHVPRFHGMQGHIMSFRGLVQPWYGYEIKFDNPPGHHFFHERDLEFGSTDEHVVPAVVASQDGTSRTNGAPSAA